MQRPMTPAWLALTLMGCTPTLTMQTMTGETVRFNGASVSTSAQLNQKRPASCKLGCSTGS